MSESRTGCSVPDCTRTHEAKGLCSMHYSRSRRNGGSTAQKILAGASVEDRLRRYSTPVGDCLEWTGASDRDGYGRIKIGGRMWCAHRAAYEVAHGPISSGLVVRHLCDNPACILPEHLELGTHQENMDDRRVRGRAPYGERHGNAKLTEMQVLEIRKAVAQGATCKEVAARYGCSAINVSMICRGKSWAYLEGIERIGGDPVGNHTTGTVHRP